MIILESWDDLDVSKLPSYDTFNFEASFKYLEMNFYRDLITKIKSL